jgi:hypothetical protein
MILGGLAVASMLSSMSACDGDDGSLGDEAVATDSTEGESDSESDGETEDETDGESDGETGVLDTTDAGDTTDTDDTTDADDTTDTSDTDDVLSFTADVYPLFKAECSCHVSNTPGMLPMPNAATAYANLIDVDSIQVALDRVEPGDPAASHLFKKITNTQTFGEPMPSMGPLLTPDQVMLVATWIAGGALE